MGAYRGTAGPTDVTPVIAVTVLTFAWTGVVTPPDWRLAAGLVLAWTLVCLAMIDLAILRLPDAFTLPLLGAGLALSLVLPGRPILDHALGAAAGWSLLAALGWAYRRWRGVDGIGLGDAKLLGAAGAWLGWPALPSVLLIACAAAFIWIAALRVRDGASALGRPLAFGAPLCLAILTVWLQGPLAI